MPIYEYRCQSCDHTLDALQKLSDKQLRKCPECGKPALKRLMSAPSFRLKGGGWYETDFKSDSEKKRNLVDGAGDKTKDEAKAKDTEKSKDDTKPKAEGKSKEKLTEKKVEPKETKSKSKATGKGSGSEAA